MVHLFLAHSCSLIYHYILLLLVSKIDTSSQAFLHHFRAAAIGIAASLLVA